MTKIERQKIEAGAEQRLKKSICAGFRKAAVELRAQLQRGNEELTKIQLDIRLRRQQLDALTQLEASLTTLTTRIAAQIEVVERAGA